MCCESYVEKLSYKNLTGKVIYKSYAYCRKCDEKLSSEKLC